MFTPFPCVSSVMECPVRWRKYFPYPAFFTTLRQTSSTCHP